MDRLYDWATMWPETRARYVVRVVMNTAWAARCAVGRWRRGMARCPRCNGAGGSAGSAFMPCDTCGGFGEVERSYARELRR